ncbi:hypothetical protein DTO002I6_370 [Penicillium roqueforti]|nr:hypothetical protein DTO002I6_370 [Penicillium roqueforti]
MASKRSYIFRVTGLSRKLLDEELKTALHNALNDNFADDERSYIKAKITIVPSYYKSDTERVALVQFRGLGKRALPDHVEDKVPLHADHSEVVKFDTRNAAGYRIALDKLRQFSKEAPSVVAARFTQTRPKPQPCSTVPFKKDPMFIGREAVISAIKERHKAIGQRHERVALVGLAGVRKTQTAIEYSYRVRESTPDMWVFWIHASNAARLEQGYQQIAAAAEVPGRDDPKMNILQLVYQWLCDARNGRWLMVLDNADDDGIFFSDNTFNERGPLVSFLPQAAHGSILITSRNGLAARNLVGSDRHVITVQPMNEDESLTLLRARVPASQSGESGESGEDEKALVLALEYIPLAVTQAGAYIANRSSRVTDRDLCIAHKAHSPAQPNPPNGLGFGPIPRAHWWAMGPE